MTDGESTLREVYEETIIAMRPPFSLGTLVGAHLGVYSSGNVESEWHFRYWLRGSRRSQGIVKEIVDS